MTEQAARKELNEETGRDVDIGTLLCENDFEENGWNFHYFCFTGGMKSEKVTLGEKVRDCFVFMPVNGLKNAKLSPNVRMLIKNHPNIPT